MSDASIALSPLLRSSFMLTFKSCSGRLCRPVQKGFKCKISRNEIRGIKRRNRGIIRYHRLVCQYRLLVNMKFYREKNKT